jgi:hypothetical protein
VRPVIQDTPSHRVVFLKNIAYNGLTMNQQQLQTQLERLRVNLENLQEREAKYGDLDVPLSVLNQINDHKTAIGLVEQAMAGTLATDRLVEEMQRLLVPWQQGQVVGVPHILPPDRKAVAAYMRKLAQRLQEEQLAAIPDGNEMLERLYSQEFFVTGFRQVGVQPRRLFSVLRQYLGESGPGRETVMLVADTGVGKTPALQHVLATITAGSGYFWAGDTDQGDQAAPMANWLLPLSLSLADLGPGQSLLRLVRAAYNRDAETRLSLDETNVLLTTYNCLLILDDLDEYITTARGAGIGRLRQFIDNYSDTHFIFACRSSVFNYQLGPMDVFVLNPLLPAQVKKVLGSSYKSGTSLDPVFQNRSMLKVIVRQGLQDTQRLNRGTLNQILAYYELKLGRDGRGQLPANSDALDPEMAVPLLEELAYKMRLERTENYSEQDFIEFLADYLERRHETAPWRMVARHLRDTTGVLVQAQNRSWHFRERTTFAYFTAAAIAHNPGLLAPLLENVTDYWWQEPLEMLVGLTPDPEELLLTLIDRDVFVAAHCTRFVGRAVDDRIVATLVDAIVERMRYEQAAGRERLVRLLIETGYRPPRAVLWRMLDREKKSLVIMVIANALASETPESSDPVPDEDVHRPDPELQQVIDAWHAYLQAGDDANQDGRLRPLLDLLSADTRAGGLAAIALGFIGTDEARKALLRMFNRADTTPFVAWCVAEALTQIKHIDVEQAALQVYHAADREIDTAGVSEEAVRTASQRQARAVYLLGNVGRKGQPQVIEVIDHALTDEQPKVRGYAARAVGRLGLEYARERLEAHLEVTDHEPDDWTLRRYIEALGQIGTLESIPVLTPFLRNEKFRTRRRTREAIACLEERYEFRTLGQ